jgi:uncharacterized protein with NRDE domain
MCLILLAHDAHPRYRLVVAANRDEFYARPTAPADWWEDAPTVLAGRDLRGGGTWMGVDREGRWAAVTNYRDPGAERTDAPSRGELVGGFLRGRESPDDYIARLRPRAGQYNGFNLLVGEPGAVLWLSNRAPEPRALDPGIHGVSNHLLDTPWPKVERGKRALGALLREPRLGAEPMLDLLLDRTVAADHQLPDTGVGLTLERALSTMFIATPEYGTRSSTALLVDRDGGVLLVERTHRPGASETDDRRFEFSVSVPRPS